MIEDEELDQRVLRLLDEATHLYRGHARATALLGEAMDRLLAPLRLAVAGPPRSGKSTLINALLGEDIAPVEPGLLTFYRDGAQPQAWLHPDTRAPYQVPMTRSGTGLRLTLPDRHADDSRVSIEWPNRVLRRTQLIDTAGLLPEQDGDPRVRRVFREADAVLYLTPHVTDTDLRFLRAGRGTRGASAFPVHVIVVLSRADATGGGRTDALLNARQIARRRRREHRVGMLCQDVVAAAPLIGHAGRTLRPDEYAAIAAIARLPRPDVEGALLSTDRFTAATALPGVPHEQRAMLLGRLGLGGVRLAVTLVRTGSADQGTLGDQLQEHSGLRDVQTAVADLFTVRGAVLRARSALTTLDHLLHTEPRQGSGHLLAESELVVAGAHEFRELRLLSAVRSGRVTLPPDSAAEAKRVLGGDGISVGERLGLSTEATAEDIWSAADIAADRWRRETRRDDLTAAQRRAAEVVLRSCDAIVNWLDRSLSNADMI